jgi:hypothetical protein
MTGYAEKRRKTMIPKGAKKIAIRPVALGEVTGHSHQLVTLDSSVCLEDVVEMFEMESETGVNTYLRVTGDCVALVHEEHKTNPVAPGEYEVVIQQESTDWGARPVVD